MSPARQRLALIVLNAMFAWPVDAGKVMRTPEVDSDQMGSDVDGLGLTGEINGSWKREARARKSESRRYGASSSRSCEAVER